MGEATGVAEGVGVVRVNISRGPAHWIPTTCNPQCDLRPNPVHSPSVPSDPEQVKLETQVEGERDLDTV